MFLLWYIFLVFLARNTISPRAACKVSSTRFLSSKSALVAVETRLLGRRWQEKHSNLHCLKMSDKAGFFFNVRSEEGKGWTTNSRKKDESRAGLSEKGHVWQWEQLCTLAGQQLPRLRSINEGSWKKGGAGGQLEGRSLIIRTVVVAWSPGNSVFSPLFTASFQKWCLVGCFCVVWRG